MEIQFNKNIKKLNAEIFKKTKPRKCEAYPVNYSYFGHCT